MKMKIKKDWNRVQKAIGFINAFEMEKPLLDLHLPNASPSYGGDVGLFTAENHHEADTYTVLNFGYYNTKTAVEWMDFALEQLDEKQQRVFGDGLRDGCLIEVDGGIHCSCGAPAEVEFDEETVTLCACCAGCIIGAALDDEQTVAKYMEGEKE